MVIFNHTNERGFYRYISDVPGSLIWILNLLPSIMCKSAVPVFFMISGSMLLNKNESVTRTYKRSIKILIDIILFSLLYYGFDYIKSGAGIQVDEIIKSTVQRNYWHLWYLYSYVALIITLPFFRKFAASIGEIEIKLIYSMACILMIVYPVFQHFVSTINGCLFPFWITTNIFIYPLLGYAIDHKLDTDQIGRKKMIGMWLLNIVVFVVAEIAEYFYLLREPGNSTETFLTITCVINAPLIYFTTKRIFKKVHVTSAWYRLITEIGKCTFGIYLLHIFVLWRIPFFYNMCVKIEQSGRMGSHAGVFLSVLLTFIISAVVVFTLRKMPLIRKLL